MLKLFLFVFTHSLRIPTPSQQYPPLRILSVSRTNHSSSTKQANLNNKSTLIAAMTNATAVFAVTNYWEFLDMSTEITQGKNLVDAAIATNISHFIWSSLPNVSKLTDGKLTKVYHFDGKAEVEEYARSTGIPATFFHAGGFMSNFPGDQLRPDPTDDGAWVLSEPGSRDSILPIFDTKDTGVFVKAAVLNRDKVLGKTLLGATEYASFGDLLERFKKVFPQTVKTVRFVHLSDEEFKAGLVGAGFPAWVAEELLENFQQFEEYGYFFGAGLEETHALLAPEDRLTSWEEHLRQNPKVAHLK